MPTREYSLKNDIEIIAGSMQNNTDLSAIQGRSEMEEITHLGEVYARAKMNAALALACRDQANKAVTLRAEEENSARWKLDNAIARRARRITVDGNFFKAEILG